LLTPRLQKRIGRATGYVVRASRPLSGGCIAEVSLVTLSNGDRIVAKHHAGGGLKIEGWMLDYLHRHSRLPVPEVLYHDETLLLMSYIENDGSTLDNSAQYQAADLLAELHGIGAACYGLEHDTRIGGAGVRGGPVI